MEASAAIAFLLKLRDERKGEMFAVTRSMNGKRCKAGEILNFAQEIAEKDLVLACEG
jgi:hypothetical protein